MRKGEKKKGPTVTMQDPDLEEPAEEHDSNSQPELPDNAYFSYYRDDNKETGGMEVKWTIRVATGAEAARLDDRQNQAIRELLAWVHRRRQQQRRP
jgi:hypothetical protein